MIAVENLTIVSNSEVAEAAARTSGGMRNNLLITLMVDSRQAEALQLAIEHGTIALAMRNPGDNEFFESDATLLSDGLLAQLAEMLGPQVVEDEYRDPVSDDIELAAIESGAGGHGGTSIVARANSTDGGGASRNNDVVVAAAQMRDSAAAQSAPKQSNSWRVEIIRALVSTDKVFTGQN